MTVYERAHPMAVRHPDAIASAVHDATDLVGRGLRLASKAAYECVLGHSWKAAHAGDALARAIGCPHLAVLYETAVGRYEGNLAKGPAYVAEMQGWVGTTGARVLVPTQALAREYMQVFRGACKPQVAPTGIWPDEWITDAHLPDFRALFAQPEEALLVCMGPLDERAGLDTVLEALDRVAQRRPCVLALAGDGPMAEPLRQRGLERIRLAGCLAGAPLVALLRCADVHVAATVYSPLASHLLEAAACGLPTVASDLGAHREVASQTATSLVPPRDARALARAILSCLAAPATRSVDPPSWSAAVRTTLALAEPRLAGAK